MNAGIRRAWLGLGVVFVLAAGCSSSSPTAPDEHHDASLPADAAGVDAASDGAGVCPSFQPFPASASCIDDAGAPIAVPVGYLGCSNQTDAPPDGASPNAADFEKESPIELNDDACKFHMIVRRICGGDGSLLFLISGTQLTDGTPATGAAPYFEAALGLAHHAPNTHPVTTEVSPGTYTIGPIVLDRPGQWTMVLHFYGLCPSTDPAAAHAHGTFLMNVP